MVEAKVTLKCTQKTSHFFHETETGEGDSMTTAVFVLLMNPDDEPSKNTCIEWHMVVKIGGDSEIKV